MLCVDEMGPVSAKSYHSRRWSRSRHRLSQEADYGRRAKLWVFGALEEPTAGQTFTASALQRTNEHFVAFLDQMVQQWPTDELFVIPDLATYHFEH